MQSPRMLHQRLFLYNKNPEASPPPTVALPSQIPTAAFLSFGHLLKLWWLFSPLLRRSLYKDCRTLAVGPCRSGQLVLALYLAD